MIVLLWRLPNLFSPPVIIDEDIYIENAPMFTGMITQRDVDLNILHHLQRIHFDTFVEVTLENMEEFFPIADPSVLRLPAPRIWIHIPKTGGLSIKELFLSHDPSCYQMWGDPHDFERLLLLDRDLIYGHFTFGIHEYYREIGRMTSSYGVTLRDPVDRVISNYWFVRESEFDPKHRMAMKYSLDEWLDNSRVGNNLQTQFLYGEYDVVIDETKFLQAKRNLAMIPFVGLMERWNETLALMEHYLGIEPDFSVFQNQGKSRKHQQPTEKTIAKIKEHNKWDIKLYEFAKQKFERQLRIVGNFK